MTRSARRLRTLAWMVLWTYLAMGLQPFDALVLCIDAQGHVALEAATADGVCFDCPPVEPQDAGGCCSEPSPQSEPAPCDCDDVVLLAGMPDGAISSSPPTFQSKARLAPPVRLQALEMPMCLAAPRERNGMQRPPGGLRAGRNAVLRI